MPASLTNKIGFSYNYGLGENGWKTGYDENWIRADSLIISTYGYNRATTIGLTYGYLGGYAYAQDGTLSLVAAGTIVLTNNTDNYVQRSKVTGAVTSNTVGFTSGYIPMAKVTTLGGIITNVVDARVIVLASVNYPVIGAEFGVVDTSYIYGNAKRYGAIGDGIVDDTAAIQAAIDNSIYIGLNCRVRIPGGKYKTTSVIHAGYGSLSTHGAATGLYNAVVIEGEGSKYRGEGTLNGTSIVPNFSDQPCINFQGSRSSRLRHITLEGLLSAHIRSNNMGGPGGTVPLIDDTVLANWNDGTLAATQDSRYCPYAGISVDAYAGVRPGTSYPNVTYPATLVADVTQYNKSFSSDVILEDVYIGGFNVGLVVQPCDADGNGDFVICRDILFEECKWGISVCNSQSRGVQVSNCKFTAVYSMLVDNVHGRQQGKFDGHIDTINAWGCIQVFQFGNFYYGPLTITQIYCESLWRLGTLNALSSAESGIVFIQPELGMSNQNDARGYPAYFLDSGQQAIDITFIGGIINLYNNAFFVGINQFGGVKIHGTQIRQDTPRANTYQQLANNATGGGWFFPRLGNPDYASLKVLAYNLDTGVKSVVSQFTTKNKVSDRTTCACWYSEGTCASGMSVDDLPSPPIPAFTAFSKASFSVVTLVAGELTLTFAARSAYEFSQIGYEVGDIILDDATGSLFLIHTRTGLVIGAKLQNNYKLVAGVVTPLVAISTAVGNLYTRNTRFYTPTFYTRADTTAGSATLTNVARDDAFTGYLTTDIVIGDDIYIDTFRDTWAGGAAGPISNVTAGTIVMTSSVGIINSLKRRLKWFIRKPPANV